MPDSTTSSPHEVDMHKTQPPTKPSHWTLLTDYAGVTPETLQHAYLGSGTPSDPYLVEFLPDDARNPRALSSIKKWTITFVMAIATLAVAFASSAYSGGAASTLAEFHVSQEVFTLGISLFVVGFAVGPLLWAPLSELYGRQKLFIGTYLMVTVFNAAAARAQNMPTLLAMRLLAGLFGSSPLTNAGGVIADLFDAEARGLAGALFACAPFLGPALGPIVGGFVGETIGWRWIQGITALFTGTVLIVGALIVPETYAPVLLRLRAAKLSSSTGKTYISILDRHTPATTARHAFGVALTRPWILLFREPIVLLTSVYMAIIYGTLYMLFGAFPYVYQLTRGWSPGLGGLAFTGVMVGMILGGVVQIATNNAYIRIARASPGGVAPPETRLRPALLGAVALPVGLFWFAWTNSPSIHWAVSIVGTIPFGLGMVLVFLAQMNYLMDAYTVYAASVLAANSVLRSLFGAAFPLFTEQMYKSLGIHWASSVPAFLALVCMPLPFLFWRFGARIRKGCRYAAEAERIMAEMKAGGRAKEEKEEKEDKAEERV